MLVACWSAKGGAGTTVVATALAAVLARSSPVGRRSWSIWPAMLPAVLGSPTRVIPGLTGLADTPGPDVPPDALTRLELDVGGGLILLPERLGAAVGRSDRGDVLGRPARRR